MKATPTRYHALLISLHWLLAALTLLMLLYGAIVMAHMPNESAEKIPTLRWHMSIGFTIFVLTLIRLVVRLKTDKPAAATTGHALLDKLAPLAHGLLYLLVVLMVGSGIAISAAAGLPDIVFGASGTPLPHSLMIYPARVVHEIVAKAFLLVIVLHIAAALYHQLILKDGLMRRMRFGK